MPITGKIKTQTDISDTVNPLEYVRSSDCSSPGSKNSGRVCLRNFLYYRCSKGSGQEFTGIYFGFGLFFGNNPKCFQDFSDVPWSSVADFRVFGGLILIQKDFDITAIIIVAYPGAGKLVTAAVILFLCLSVLYRGTTFEAVVLWIVSGCSIVAVTED